MKENEGWPDNAMRHIKCQSIGKAWSNLSKDSYTLYRLIITARLFSIEDDSLVSSIDQHWHTHIQKEKANVHRYNCIIYFFSIEFKANIFCKRSSQLSNPCSLHFCNHNWQIASSLDISPWRPWGKVKSGMKFAANDGSSWIPCGFDPTVLVNRRDVTRSIVRVRRDILI